MPGTRYVTPWSPAKGRGPKPAFATLRGPIEADVVIVGAGAVGCLTAYLCARAGRRTVLLEAGRVADGATSGAAGLVLPGTGGSFHAHRERLGLRAARYAWESSRRAALELTTLVRRLGIRCDLAARDHLDVALDAAAAAALERDYRSLREAGLEAAWLPARRVRALLRLDGVALRLKGGASLDPVRAVAAFARHAERLGAAVLERSPVTRIRRRARAVEIVTAGGSVTAARVIVATGLPRPGFGALARHLTEIDEFAVMLPSLPAATRRSMGAGGVSVRERGAAARTWHWTRDDRLVFQGAAAEPEPKRILDRVVVQRSGQLMYEVSCRYPDVSGIPAEHGWATRTVRTADGLPVAGPHRNYPRHLFGIAPGTAGLNAALLVARVLARHVDETVERDDAALGFVR